MKKKNNPQPAYVVPEKILQGYEDAVLKKAETSEKYFHEDNLEAFMDEVKDYTRAELIQALREERNQSDEFALWLLRKHRSTSEIAEKIDQLNLEKISHKNKRAHARKDRSIRDASKKTESLALGVDDLYGLIAEAITIYESWDVAIKKQYRSKISGIQKAITVLLCQPNRSRHTHIHEEWEQIIGRQIESKHIDAARKRLKRSQIKST